MRRYRSLIIAVALSVLTFATVAYAGRIIRSASGTKMTYQTGTELEVQSGATLDHQSGATLVLHGLTFTAAEVGYLDGITAGQSLNSKALVMDSNGKIDIAAADTLNIDGVFSIGNTIVTSSAVELNYNDVTTLGQSQNSKVLTFDANGKADVASADTLNIDGVFSVGNTTVSASAAELNYTDITAAGQSQNSKALVMDANGKIDIASADTLNVDGVLSIANATVSASAAELNYTDITAAGQSENSKALVLDSNGKIDIASADTLNVDGVFSIANTTVSASAAEIDYNDLTTLGTSQNSKVATYSSTGKHTVASGDTTDYASGSALAIGGVKVDASAAELNLTDGLVIANYTITGGDGLDTLINANYDANTIAVFTVSDGDAAWISYALGVSLADTLFITAYDTSGTAAAGVVSYSAIIKE